MLFKNGLDLPQGGLFEPGVWSIPTAVPFMPTVLADLHVSSEEINTLCFKSVPFEARTLCGECEGTGAFRGKIGMIPCKECDEKTHCTWQELVKRELPTKAYIPCRACKGSGMVVGWDCAVCNGQKTPVEKMECLVALHKDMKTGDIITFQGQGHQAPNGLRRDGDLQIRVVRDGEHVQEREDPDTFDGGITRKQFAALVKKAISDPYGPPGTV